MVDVIFTVINKTSEILWFGMLANPRVQATGALSKLGFDWAQMMVILKSNQYCKINLVNNVGSNTIASLRLRIPLKRLVGAKLYDDEAFSGGTNAVPPVPGTSPANVLAMELFLLNDNGVARASPTATIYSLTCNIYATMFRKGFEIS